MSSATPTLIPLDIRCSYNVLLWHYLDSLSQWDFYSCEHVRNWHQATFGISEQLRDTLQRYAKARSALGWEAEIELFCWADAGFPHDARFNCLDEFVETISRCATSTESLADVLKKQLPYLTDVARLVTSKLDRVHAVPVVNKLKSLFPQQRERELPTPIPAFLAWSPEQERSQGGANGLGVYTEVYPSGDKVKDARHVAEIFFHELLHLLVSPRIWLAEVVVADDPELFRAVRPWIYDGREGLSHLLDEAIVLTVANVISFGDSASKQHRYWSEKAGQEPAGQAPTLAIIWTVVTELEPLLRGYLADQVGKEQVHARLLEISQGLLKEVYIGRKT